MNRKKGLASLLACSLLLAAAPVEAMAYKAPETVRVGLESVCKNAASATIGVWDLYVGMEHPHMHTPLHVPFRVSTPPAPPS